MNRNAIAKAAVGGAEGSTFAVHNVGLIKRWVFDDGLSTNHSSHPPVRSGRSAGRFNPSDLPAAPVSGGRQNRPGRRLRTLSLPALGVAAGLLAVFLTMPTLWAHAQTYTLTDDDVGKKVKVKVSFTDELSSVEMRTSAAYPSSGTVTAVTVTSTPHKTTDTYGAREHIEFSMTFDKPVTVTGAPTFSFVIGTTTKTATWYAGSGTDTLRFSYSVGGGSSGDLDTDGISWAANALALNGGTITGTGNAVAATLTHGAQSNLAGHKVDGRTTAVTPATVTVAVTSTPMSPADTYGFDETIVITVTASEAVEVVGDPEFEFSLTDLGAPANDVPATYDRTRSSATAIVFTYTVQAGDTDNNGIWIGDHSRTFMLDANDRIRTASQKIDIDRSHPEYGTHADHKVDGSLGAPTVPPDPTPPTLVSATATTLTVEWTHPGDGGSPLLRNYVHYRVQGVTEWSNWYAGETPVTRAVITNLEADTAYEVRVHNTNAIGSRSWVESTTTFRTRANTPATGAPSITGTATVGQELTATTGTIADADGLPSSFSYQWVRVDADGTSNPVDIPDANAATYTLTDDDLGKKVKVRVSFTDNLDSTEMRTSDAFPSSDTVTGTSTAAWAANAYTADEGERVTVTATLHTAADEPTPSENYFIRMFTRSDSATGVDDYTPVTTNLTVTPIAWKADGAVFTATVELTVQTVGDNDLEGDERFYVILVKALNQVQPGLECPDDLRNLGDASGCATVVTIADDETLSVTEVTVSSTPAAGETYLAGEAIEFTVAFIASVTVTGTPTFAFTLGSAVRQATYASGSGTAALVFSYTVLAGDLDRDGISWEADALALAGGTIRLTTDDPSIVVNAALAHEGEDAQAAHRVDAVAPSLVSETVEDTTLELVYDEALDGGSEPAASAYTVAVTVGTTTTNPTVSAVAVAGTTVTLTLSAAPADGATVTVSYTVPTGTGAMPVRDVAGNNAGPLTNRSVSVGAALRLVGGTGDHEGRLEILHDSQWGTVCDDYWTDVEAGVVCRILEWELGAVDNRGRIRDEQGRSLPPSFGPTPAGMRMWLDNVNCEGNETSLLACPRRSNLAVGVHNCRPSEAVGVQCRIVPKVKSVAVSPASGPYTGGTLQVTVEWNQPVVVTTPAGGLAPKLMVQYGTGSVTQEHDAVYASGSGTAALVFEHRLAGGDSFESVKVLANTLEVRGGAIVWKTDKGVDADLAHGTIASNQLEAPVVVAAPVVVGAPALSKAGADGAWTPGEKVEVTLTFSESVTVGTADGTPSIGLQLSGTQAQRAPYASGTGTAKLVFGYTLTDADGPHSTLRVPPDSLALNDGTIVSTADSTIDADLAHDGAAKSAVPEPVSARATRGVADGPTASFSNLPATHDGEKPFTVKLSFSAEPRGLSYKTVRDSLLEVTGGTVTKALRVTDASDREWNVTVEPSQGYDITLTLPARTCGETGAVCIGGRPLAAPASATIPGKALTASLSGPAEHDGSKSFKVRLTFSMEPDVSYKTVSDTMFTEKGGTIKKAGRVAPPADLEFDITAEPDGDGAVSLSLASPLPACGETGAVCTAAGRKIEGTVSATIPGPVAISVADAAVREGSGAVLAFEVTLDRARSETVTVDYATVPGNGAGVATEGSDYTATSGTLTFAANETLKTVSVPVLVDGHDEDAETMTLTLASPSPSDYVRIADGTATGTITNTGPMPGVWLARFGRTVGSQVLEAVNTRFDGSSAASHLNVGGARLGGTPPLDAAAPLAPQDWLAAQLAEGTEAQHPEERTLSARELLLGSSFHLVSQAETGSAAAFSAWGRVSTGGFRAEVDDLTLDGDVTTGLLGFDAEWERLLAGLVLAHSEGDGGYNLRGGERGSIESSLTGIYPYARLRLNDRVLLWGLAGAGSGDLTLVWRNEAIDTGLDMRLGAVGVRGTLLAGGGFDLAVKSDALWVRTDSDAAAGLAAATAQVSRLRLILEAERTMTLASGAVLAPTAQVGLRHDGGDAETGTGVEVGAGIRYTAGMLTIEGQVRTLLAHEAGGYEEWGASGSIRLSPNASGLGPSLALLPSWGASGSAVARLWAHPDASALVQGSTAAPAPGRLDAEFGWGLSALRGRGVLTPYARVALAEGDNQSWHLGTRLTLAESLNLSLEGSRRRFTGGDTAHDLTLRASLPW